MQMKQKPIGITKEQKTLRKNRKSENTMNKVKRNQSQNPKFGWKHNEKTYRHIYIIIYSGMLFTPNLYIKLSNKVNLKTSRC
jgi:hypothetical protein